MLRAYALKTDEELEDFAGHYYRAANALLDLPFMRTSSVYALLHRSDAGQEVIAGGLVVRNRPPYRSLACVPPAATVEVPTSVLELVGLFIHKPYRNAKARAFVSFGCFLSILLSRQKYLLAFIAHSDIDADHAAEVRDMLAKCCKTESDWQAVEQVMERSLYFTERLLVGVDHAYELLTSGRDQTYTYLNSLRTDGITQ